jgi:O-antigen/teichoic acid export membrane protein
MIPAGLTTVGLTMFLVRHSLSLVPRFRGVEWWSLVRDTLPYAAAIAVNTLYFRVTIIVMSLTATAEETGYFATSFRVIEVLIGVPALAIGAAFPILSRSAREDQPRFRRTTERVVELSLIAGVAMALTVALLAPFVIRVIAGPTGTPAVEVLQIQAVALVATFVAVGTGFPLLSLRRHSALLIANSAALVINIVLTLVLVPLAQARGAALAGVIAETSLAIGQLLLLQRAHGRLIRLRSLVGIAVAGLLAAAPLLVAVHPILRTVAGLAIYAALLAVFGLTPPELRDAISRGRHRTIG